MFIRKLFKISDKAKWLTLELLIVFIGVYLAFLFQSYSEDRKLGKEKEKVLVSLKLELEEFRTSFPRFADYQESKTKEWDSLYNLGIYEQYYQWRYLEPQYNFKIIEYAINQEGTDVIDFELYESLSKLYGEIRQLEHAERMMTEYGGKFSIIPSQLNADSPEALILKSQNRFHFYKFRGFARDRTGDLRRVANRSEELVKIVNEQLGPKKVREVELGMISDYLDAGIDADFIKSIFLENFPAYTAEELDEEFEKLRERQISSEQK